MEPSHGRRILSTWTAQGDARIGHPPGGAVTTPIVPYIEVVITGPLNASTLRRWRRLLDEAVAAGPAHLVVDFAGCAELDQTGTALLAGVHERMWATGGATDAPGHESPAEPGPACGANTGWLPTEAPGTPVRAGSSDLLDRAAVRARRHGAGSQNDPDGVMRRRRPAVRTADVRHELTPVGGAACGLPRRPQRTPSSRSSSPTRWTRTRYAATTD
ncbi:STAS domain-containing protein [Dactylosporangium aurantiacum]